MTFSTSSRKRTAKSSFKDVSAKDISAFDLFYQLSYMSATAAAGLSRSRVFALGAELPTKVAEDFARVQELVHSLHYDYPNACRLAGEEAERDEIKSFLFRFSDALESGNPMAAFLESEAAAQGDLYGNEYERDLESLKKWTDAYSSLIMAEALLVIVNLVSTMIYDLGMTMMLGLVIMAVLISLFGAWILSRAAPQEQLVVSAPDGAPDQILIRWLVPIVVPIIVAVSALLVLVGVPWTGVLFLPAIALAPLGLLSSRSDKELRKRDSEIATFLRSLGGMATSTGVTLTQALGRMDLNPFPNLRRDIERLRRRLTARIDPALCWGRFATETGSQLIRQVIGTFQQAVTLGGDPEEVAAQCSLFATKVSMLRAKRGLVSATFLWLVIAMHGALSALMIFVLHVVIRFRAMIETALSPEQMEMALQAIDTPLLTFSAGQMTFLGQMAMGMVFVLVVANALALSVTEGGFKPKVCLYLSLLLAMSGVSFIVVPPLVEAIL